MTTSGPSTPPVDSPPPAAIAGERTSAEAFLARMALESPKLSRQLLTIGRYFESHRERVALERVQDIASACGVQPSAVIRFAKHFGFSGFSEMQQLFKEEAARRIAPAESYAARMQDLVTQSGTTLTETDIGTAFVEGAIAGLRSLQRDLDPVALASAAEWLCRAAAIWVVGMRRSFPAASYLAYALQQADRPVRLLSTVGGMLDGELRSMREREVLVVISFQPYAAESIRAAERAREVKAFVIAITDSRMGPISQLADQLLLVQESSIFGFRTLTNTMTTVQALFASLAYRQELARRPVS